MNTLGPNALIAAIVLPFFYLAVYLDYAISRAQGRADYEIKDTVASLGVSFMMSALGTLTIVLRIVIYSVVYQHLALAQWPLGSVWSWLLGLLLYDFSYYWQHRKGHEWNLLWASHVVHHSSDRFNLATALRVPAASMNLWTWLFALPLAILGVPPQVYAVASLLNLLYQFWIHTERVGRLAWFDRCFGSPSNHRVHHGVNAPYLDKNYGGILMLWDHAFGTFAEERADEPVRYGTRAPVRSWNPLWINLDSVWSLCKQAYGARDWRDKLRIWWQAPGWIPAGSAPSPLFDLSQHRHFETSTLPSVARYALLQTALLPAMLVHLIVVAGALPWWPELLYGVYLSLSAIALGLLLHPQQHWRRFAALLEFLRLLWAALLAWQGQWFGQLPLPRWAALATLVVVALSLMHLAWVLRERSADAALPLKV